MRNYNSPGLSAISFLIAANILIFIVELVTGEGIARRSEVIPFLGLIPAEVLRHPWTIISSLFVHASAGHIICNMISLYFLGNLLIRLVGENDFLKIYFAGGLLGNLCYILLGPPSVIGIGASGAIFAIGGTLAMIAPRLPVFMFFIPVPTPLWAAMAIFLVLSFFVSGIAWQAHLGGFILGLVAGYLIKKKRRIRYF